MYCEDCSYNQYNKLMWKCKPCQQITLLEDIKELLETVYQVIDNDV